MSQNFVRSPLTLAAMAAAAMSGLGLNAEALTREPGMPRDPLKDALRVATSPSGRRLTDGALGHSGKGRPRMAGNKLWRKACEGKLGLRR